MRIKAKLVHKYQEQNGVSERTGQPWRRQEMKFQLLKDDWSEGNESIVVNCNNSIYLDAPALAEGAVGILSFWASADEYNGRCYNRMNMNGWTPQSEAGEMVAQQQQAQAPAAEKKDGLPF